MAIDWATVVATLASGAIGAGGAVLGVWLTARSTRKLNEENRIKDKKQEVIISLAQWRGYLSKLMPSIVYPEQYSKPLISPEKDTMTEGLDLCVFLLQEYKFIPDSLRIDFVVISDMLLSMASAHSTQAFQIYLERVKVAKDSGASEYIKEFMSDFIVLQEAGDLDWDQWKRVKADMVFNAYVDIEGRIYAHVIGCGNT